MMMHSDWIGVNHLWWCQNWRGFKCHWGHQVGSLLPLNGLAHSFTHSLTHQVAAGSPVSSRLWLNVLPMDTLTDLGFEPSTSRSLDNPVDLLSSAALSSVQHVVTVWPEMSDCARQADRLWSLAAASWRHTESSASVGRAAAAGRSSVPVGCDVT